jgi:hypothetical protein
MMSATKKTLQLVQDSSNANISGPCSACETKKQLEHVRMLLNAALLAAAPRPVKPTRPRATK